MKFTFWAQVVSTQNKVKNTPAKKTWYFLEILLSYAESQGAGLHRKGVYFLNPLNTKLLHFLGQDVFLDNLNIVPLY